MHETNPLTLATPRLELTAATLEHVCAELEAPERLAALLHAQVEPGWPPGEYDREAQEFFRDRLKAGGLSVVGWLGWYAVRRGGELIGAGGYVGGPDEAGEVEIGFSVMPAWRGRGYATEMAQALVAKAFADRRVQKVIAHTARVNPASAKALAKCGFHEVSGNEDPGPRRFEILRSPSA